MTHDIDLLIVGGGPVGLAAAIAARMRGFTVVVVEPRRGDIDKACGEGLMPGAVAALARLGVLPEGRPLIGVGYRDATRQVDHRFRRGPGLGVRRTVLSAALWARALTLGVERVEARVRSLDQDESGVSVVGIRARYLLGADGLHSTIRRLARLEQPQRRQPGWRFGMRRHFAVEPWSELIEVHWADRAEVYVTPISRAGDPGLVGIAILGGRGTDFDSALAGFPALARRLAGVEPASALRGAGPFRQRTTRRSQGRVLLVGDASGYVDAITGEGIRVGLAQAVAAVDCIAADDPRRYEREWFRCTRDFRLLTVGLLRLADSPVRTGIVPLAAAFPQAYGAVVERLAR